MRHENATSFRRLSVCLVAALMAATNPALAADTTIRVSGDSVPSDCAAAKSPSSATMLTGNLEGCLAIFVEHFNCNALNGFDFSTELGREEFEGTLDGKPIKFDTTYQFTALWPSGSCPAPAIESEIAGGCEHHISGKGVTGIVRFYDVIPTVGKGATNFPYEGYITVSDSGTAAIAPVVRPSLDVAAADPVRLPGGLASPSSAC